MSERVSNRGFNAFVVGLCWLAVAVGGPAGAAEVRTWTDATGQFKIQAEYVSEGNGKVTLKQADGTELEIEVNKLSPADQQYVKQQSANPFQPKGNNPFQPRMTRPSTPTPTPAPVQPAAPASGAPGGSVDDSGEFQSRLVSADWSDAPVIGLGFATAEWKVDVPEAAPASGGKRMRPISLPPKTDFHEKPVRMVVNRAGTHAVIGYVQSFPRGTEHSRLVLCDLQSGKMIANRSTGGLLAPVALHDDGQTVVMCREEFGFGNHDRLELWTVTAANIMKGAAWMPYASGSGGDRDVQWAEYLPDGRLVTANHGGKAVAWNLNPVSAAWTCDGDKGCSPALSPDGRHLVIATKENTCLVDVDSQEVVGAASAPEGAFPKFSFSPSGRRIGCMTQGGGVYIWDAANGEQLRRLDLAGMPVGSPNPPLFTSDDSLLVAGQFLYDLPSQIPTWQYRGLDGVAVTPGHTWVATSDGDRKPGALIDANMPHPAVEQALEQALKDPNYFLLKPGGAIKLNFDALPDQQQRDEARQKLTQRLQEMDIKVDPNAQVELVASFDPPKEKNVIYHVFGRGDQAVDFTETVARVKIVWQGQTLWETSASNQPFSISRKEGESLQEAVKRFEKPSYGFFGGLQIPRMLAKPSGAAGSRTLGMSTVTPTGLR